MFHLSGEHWTESAPVLHEIPANRWTWLSQPYRMG